jgi:hypothetical protein
MKTLIEAIIASLQRSQCVEYGIFFKSRFAQETMLFDASKWIWNISDGLLAPNFQIGNCH